LPDDITRRGLFRVTRVGRTIVDLASVLDDEWLRATLDSAIRQRGSNLYWVRRAHNQHARGRDGARRLAALLARYQGPEDAGASVLESFAMDLGLATGRKPIWHYSISDGGSFNVEVDFAWPDMRLAVELDGWCYHSSIDAFQNDRARDRALGDLGWTVRRFTWHDVTRERQAFINAIERAHRQCRERVAVERERASGSPQQTL
jgi:hypothetical protein